MRRIVLLLAGFATPALFSQTPVQTEDSLRTEVSGFLDQGAPAAAEQAVRGYLAGHEQSASAHYLLGYVLFKKRDAKDSLAEYTAGARYRTPGTYDLETVASDYVLLKDYTNADKWYTKSVEADGANISALYYLARTKYNENRFEEAISVFQQCLRQDPKNVKYEDNLGLSFQGLGRNEEAETAFRSAIAEDAAAAVHNGGPYLDLGSLLMQTARVRDAIPFLVQAARFTPDDLRVHTQLGKAYLQTDDLGSAQAQLQKAIALAPDYAPTHFILAQVFRKLGQPEKARRESETYTRLNREHPNE